SFYFLPRRGLGKIELRRENATEELYERIKNALASKYGKGEENNYDYSHCDLSLEKYYNSTAIFADFFAHRKGVHYLIKTDRGDALLDLREDSRCRNVPARVYKDLFSSKWGPISATLELRYTKREPVDPNKL